MIFKSIRILLVVVLFITSLYYSLKSSNTPPSISANEYLKMEIHGIIDTIYKYDRGYPVVLINSKRITLAVPAGCSKYLVKNDSISKKASLYHINTFRFNNNYIQVIFWGAKEEGDNAKPDGFISSYKIVKK